MKYVAEMRRKRLEVLWLLSLGLVIFAMLPPSVVQGQTIVVPNSLTVVEGNGNNLAPFTLPGRYQQVFLASEIAGGPVFITQITFRPDPAGGAFSTTIPNIQINLSTTTAAPDGLSATFASNVGGDDTVVIAGLLSLSSAFSGPAAGPKAFDIVINLPVPFLYDPAQGNLLFDVRNFDFTGVTAIDGHSALSDSISRVSSFFDVNAPTGNLDSFGLVALFTTVTAPACPCELFTTTTLPLRSRTGKLAV